MDNSSSTEDHDSTEWEYEYSNTETESFYAIIDLGPNAAYRSTRKARRSLRRTESADSNETATFPVNSSQQEKVNEDPSNRLQILDLHTASPLLSYDSYFYRLEWNSPITSTFLYAHTPSPTLLTTMPARLVGIPSTLVPMAMDRMRRRDLMITSSNDADGDDQNGGKATTEVDTGGILWEDGKPTTIPLGPDVSSARKKQAKFLEQLMRAKRKKGEEDEVTVFATKRFVPWKRGRSRKKARGGRGKYALPPDEGQEEDQDEMSVDEVATDKTPRQESDSQTGNQSAGWPGVVTTPITEGTRGQASLPVIQSLRDRMQGQSTRGTKRGRPRTNPIRVRGTVRGRPRGSKVGKGLPGLWGTLANDSNNAAIAENGKEIVSSAKGGNRRLEDDEDEHMDDAS